MRRFFLWTLVLACGLAAATDIAAQKYGRGLVDKTIALVGNEMIMLSELESDVLNLTAYGYASDRNLRCEVLEKMLEAKLFIMQARLDSLSVNPDYVNLQLEDYVSNMISRFGGVAEMEKFYGKKEYQLREEWREMFMEQGLMQEMQRTISSKVPELTPRDVENYYRRMPEDSLPMVSTQYQYRQIVLYPEKEAAALDCRERLLEFRQRIMDGDSFSLLATLYSDCPSASRGGDLGMAPKSNYVPEFADAASMLKENQVSPVVETPFGFHLIQMIRQDGDMIHVRHILLKPKYGEEDRKRAFHTLDSLRRLVLADSLSFADAARFHSEDPKTRTGGGMVIEEQYTNSSFFAVDLLKPQDYAALKDLKPGEISQPFESTDNEGADNLVYKIVRLEQIIPSHRATFKQDFATLQNQAANQAAQAAIDRFVDEKIRTTYIVIDPLFQSCDFRRSGWVK